MATRELTGETTAVSVIIPVCNGERTIVDAVESALRQSHPAVEVTVVLNGSTDGTARLLRRFGADIRVITLPAPSAYKAREAGFAASTAPVVTFLDCDDTLARDAVGNALGVMYSEKADVVQMRLVQRLNIAGVPLSLRFPCAYDTRLAMEGALYDVRLFNPGMPAKLFRRSALEPFPQIGYDGYWGEDRLFSLHLYHRNLKVTFCRAAVYNYRFGGASRNPASASLREAEYREIHRLKREFAATHGLDRYIPMIDRELDDLLAHHQAMLHRPTLKNRLKRALMRLSR